MRNKTLLAAVLAGLYALPAIAAPTKLDGLRLSKAMGGQIDGMVVAEPYAYVVTGRVVTTWSYADPTAPTQVSAVEQPAMGRLTGLVRVGEYLYGSWRTGYGTGGVAVYSLADPSRPQLVNQVEVKSGSESDINGIGAANGQLLLFDLNNGLVVGSLNNPRKPKLSIVGLAPGVQYDDVFTDGNRVHAFGQNLMFRAVLTSFDLSNPRAPLEGPSFTGDGLEFFDMQYQGPFAVSFGMKLSLFDLSQPEGPVMRGSAFGPPAAIGIVNADYAYGLGFDGLDVWKIGDPDNPAPIAHIDIDTLGTDATASLKRGALMATRTDRFVYLDTSNPTAPKELASTIFPGSIDAYDAALAGDTVLFLQQNYGFAIADAKTLAVIDRYEFDLPPALQARGFNDMHVDGKLAYVAGWGYGLFIADISNPRAPVELSRELLPYAHTVAVEEGRAYLAKNTEGAQFSIVDVSNPADPVTLASYDLGYGPGHVEVRKGFLFIAGHPTEPGPVATGLRIVDVRDPLLAQEVAYYNDNCSAAFDVALADNGLAYVACSNGLHIVDASDAKMPVRVAHVPLPEHMHPYTNVEARGNRVWYGNVAGVYELDVTEAKHPRIVGYVDAGGYGLTSIRAIDEKRVLGLTGTAGIHVLETGASRRAAQP